MDKNITFNSIGANAILGERYKAYNKGRTPEHDSIGNDNFQLSSIASFLIYNDAMEIEAELASDFASQYAPNWNKEYLLEIMNLPYEDRLRIAGNLIASELDRLEYNKQNNITNNE